MSWRYIAVRLDGAGGDVVVHPEVPISVTGLTDVLSGPPGLTGTVEAAYRSVLADDDGPLFQEWGTAIFAERDGLIQPGGGIVQSAVPNTTGGLNIECVGYTGYPHGTPYTDEKTFVQVDALDIYRSIWTHLQEKPRGNLGLTIDSTKAGVLLGTPTPLDDSGSDKEEGPFELSWRVTKDLGSTVDDLAAHFDYHERHYWEGAVLKHHVDLGAPTIGTRRDDLGLVVGDNVWVLPTYASQNQEYADTVLALGAGEGRDMVHGMVSRPGTRLRRVALVEDKGLGNNVNATRAATINLAARNSQPSVSSLVVRDHPNAPISAIQLGDEYPYQDDLNEWIKPNTYVRVVSRTIDPKRDDQATLTVVRSGSEAA